MSHPANTNWRDVMTDVLENLDPELFLEELDPDWKSHFHDAWLGINFYMEFMSPAEFKKVLKASQ